MNFQGNWRNWAITILKLRRPSTKKTSNWPPSTNKTSNCVRTTKLWSSNSTKKISWLTASRTNFRNSKIPIAKTNRKSGKITLTRYLGVLRKSIWLDTTTNLWKGFIFFKKWTEVLTPPSKATTASCSVSFRASKTSFKRWTDRWRYDISILRLLLKYKITNLCSGGPVSHPSPSANRPNPNNPHPTSRNNPSQNPTPYCRPFGT